MIFKNRTSAGKLLGTELAARKYPNPHVFALVRGGVPVACEVAKKLKAPLDVIVVRKLGLPSFPEFGFGAIGPDGLHEIDDTIVNRYMINVNDIQNVVARERAELKRRMEKYGVHEPENLENQTVIIVDDGIATGITMLVAIKYLKQFNPTKIVVAVPVCPDTMENQFIGIADEFVCLNFEENFASVGQFYTEFPQVTDDEVAVLLYK